jgi:hypothetical protein
MDQGVKAAISEAYRIFSRYSFGANGSPPCDPSALGPLEERLLRVTPPKEIPAELLAAHAASLTATIDGTWADDFRALLPRYFELIAADQGPVSGWKEDALRGLAGSGYRTRWPAEEADAVDRLLTVLMEAAEARGASGDAITIRRFVAGAQGAVAAARQGA